MWHTVLQRIGRFADQGIVVDAWLLAARWAMAGVFFLSARTKVEGVLSIKPSTFFLFENEYALPLLDPQLAAYLATYAEHGLSILLAVGLLTPLAALGMLGMTAVIQIFVYPEAWPTHLSWACILAPLLAQGAGRWSLDHLLGLTPGARCANG